MSLSHQQYADLASDAYNYYPPGVRKPGEEEKIPINGVTYKILEHVDNPRNGYQGTTYQRMDTGDIVVAHRGTEQIARDGAYADGSMVLTRINPQAQDATELTRRARERAEFQGKMPGNHTPEVSITGHSLGGTLTQITAHHFNLHGETFNAYGAVSLGKRIPEGGNTVLNHVMATDTVSAASPHFGQVRVYAQQKEIDLLRENMSLTVAGKALGSHSMHNFTNEDGKGRPDRSILADPHARQLAQKHDPLIDEHRDDLRTMRAGITLAARGPGGLIADGIGHLRGPLNPGEPAEREQNERTSRLPATPEKRPAAPQPYDSQLFGPGALPDLPGYVPKPADGPKSPQQPQAALDASAPGTDATPYSPQHMIDRLSPRERHNYDQGVSVAQRLGLPPEKAQNFGMAMAAQINDYGLMQRTDRMVAMQGRGDDGSDRVYASYHPHGDKEPIFNTSLDVNRAASVPMEDSFRRIEQAQQQQIAQAQTQGLDEPSRVPKIA
jgi:hypothetical protein